MRVRETLNQIKLNFAELWVEISYPMKAREAIFAWSLIAILFFMAFGVGLGFKLYPFYGTQMPCSQTYVTSPVGVPNK